MVGKLISNILAISQGDWAGQIVNNPLNPLNLTIATTEYRIQSRTLQIPDRFGFFSPGPPRLQVHDGGMFIVIVGLICMNLICSAFLVFMCRLCEARNCQKAGAIFTLLIPFMVIVVWILSV